MFQETIERAGSALALARRARRASAVDLRWVDSARVACDVQDRAVACLAGQAIGYALAATTKLTSRLLNCRRPVSGILVDEFVHVSGSVVHLPYGALGIGAQFIFVVGAPLRAPISLGSVSDAIVSCRMGIQLLGRRTSHSVALDDWSATADFALDVGCVQGAEIEGWDRVGLQAIRVSLHLDGNQVARGDGPDVFGVPLGALLDLATSLQARGGSLQAGDVVALGSCTGLSQVSPGQHVRASFEGCGEVEVSLT